MGIPEEKSLPRHQLNDNAFVDIKPFETGRMATPSATLVGDAQGVSMGTSWRFLLKHLESGTNFWFDMGISHDLTVYPPQIQALHSHFKPLPSKKSIEEETIAANIKPSTIKYVIVSHGHWDHIHPPPPSFTSAKMIVGPGSISHCSPGFPSNPSSIFDGRIWDASIRTFPLHELPPITDTKSWKPLGPFPHTYDFLGDGSFYLINAPGHMEGNMAGLARVKTKAGERKWVILGGDCAHCNLFTYWPDAPFGKMPVELFPSGSLHESGDEARETIRQIAECKRIEGSDLFVWYAHGEFLEGLWEL